MTSMIGMIGMMITMMVLMMTMTGDDNDVWSDEDLDCDEADNNDDLSVLTISIHDCSLYPIWFSVELDWWYFSFSDSYILTRIE